MSTRVRNKGNGAEPDCKCGSWLKHWQRFSPTRASSYCNAMNCRGHPEIGAHVYKVVTPPDTTEFIVPLCEDCHHRTEEFEVLGSFVLADRNRTCERL